MPPLPEDSALAGMDPTGRFSERASDYVRYRPDYPSAALDAVLSGLGDPGSLVAADVGAGTGIASRLLATRGVRVLAVEPNAAMRAAAEPHPRVEWHDGVAVATGLPAAVADLVICAQAFHWFRQTPAIAEFHRILRPGGRLALVWNARDDRDPLTLGYIHAIHAVNGEHPAEHRGIAPGVVDGAGLFGPLRLLTFPHAQELDLDGLVGRATSASYVSTEPAALAELRRLLAELFERHRNARGRVSLRYRTDVHLAERSARMQGS